MSGSIVVEHAKPGTTEAPPPAPEPARPAEPVGIQLPEKYRGKTLEQLVEMHQATERELGSSRSAEGTWRSLVDDLITTKRSSDLAKAEPDDSPDPITSDALLTDPQGVIDRAVQRQLNKALKPVTERVATTELDVARERFVADFPDFVEVASSEDFKAWVAKSQIRSEDALRAAKQDLRAARRLMEDFRDARPSKPETKVAVETKTEKPTGVEGARASATEGKSGGGDVVHTGEILYKTDVLKLINTDPDKYRSDAYQKKLRLAIKEKRLR